MPQVAQGCNMQVGNPSFMKGMQSFMWVFNGLSAQGMWYIDNCLILFKYIMKLMKHMGLSENNVCSQLAIQWGYTIWGSENPPTLRWHTLVNHGFSAPQSLTYPKRKGK